jgi:hypothetical protein
MKVPSPMSKTPQPQAQARADEGAREAAVKHAAMDRAAQRADRMKDVMMFDVLME